MRVLITGGTGQLGTDLYDELISRGYDDVCAIGRSDVDITNREAITYFIEDYNPDVVFHCAAYTAVDQAEEEIEKCYQVNVNATSYVVGACQNIDSKLIYISSDYVFAGDRLHGSYEVDDPVNPKSIYGKTKYVGEEEVMKYEKSFIVRTSWVFGIHGKNFVKTMLDLSETMDEIHVVNDQIGSPTYTRDLTKLLVDMSLTNEYGIYHATNEGYCSWADLAKYALEVNGSDTKIIPISSSEYPQVAERPKNSKLSKKSLTEHGFSLLPDWKDAVQRYEKELKREKMKVLKK